ncbi:MAG: dTDP-4-dehydrorhamnose 3,5-epimerase [Myxococcota bacterium]
MQVIETDLSGVVVLQPRLFRDDRGFFLETYNQARYAEAGITCTFVQDNHSRSTKGILRGLHYQITQPQDKLVWCLQGAIYDVAVDVRRDSPTFGKWYGVTLTSEEKNQIFVPAGFAHGFCVLSETAEVAYKCSRLYAPNDEGGIAWNDPELGIEWPLDGAPTLSGKDAALPRLADAKLPD